NQFDIVQIDGIELARTIEIIRVVSPNSKIVFDDHNAETELQRRNFLTDLKVPHRWPAAAYSWLQVGRLRRFERWACLEADGVVAVSEADRDHLLGIIRKQKTKNGKQKTENGRWITVIPNSIDVTQYETVPDEVISFDLMFSGKMDYRPNVDAVLWFAEAVWPQIKKKRPFTTWAIVGQKPHARLDPLRELDGVTLTGWVDSMAPYLHGAAISIMPFRIGSGTRLKIIEAMAAKKAIVSTPIGAEGFPLRHDQELLLAETAVGLETAVLHLLNSPADQRRLGEAAYQFAQQYDWRNVVPQLDQVYNQILA
ncbi:MAG: glycosyltransferase, partial [Chloroflexi bacterium]